MKKQTLYGVVLTPEGGVFPRDIPLDGKWARLGALIGSKMVEDHTAARICEIPLVVVSDRLATTADKLNLRASELCKTEIRGTVVIISEGTSGQTHLLSANQTQRILEVMRSW